jgi:hypothetical protein
MDRRGLIGREQAGREAVEVFLRCYVEKPPTTTDADVRAAVLPMISGERVVLTPDRKLNAFNRSRSPSRMSTSGEFFIQRLTRLHQIHEVIGAHSL